MVLLPILPPVADESTVSWCSRLGPYHAGIQGPDWLKMMQISRQSVVETDDECVRRLAELTGIHVDRIRSMGVQRKGERIYAHRGQEFGCRFVSRTQTTYCPACLLEDSDPSGPSNGCRVGRVSWIFSSVRTCERHGLELFRRPNVGFHERFQDMAFVAPGDTELDRQAAAAQAREVSPLQRYIEGRFAGKTASEWLDAQQIDQAARACEILGACLVLGAHADLDKLSMEEWDTAGCAGFKAASKGPDAIRSALDDIREASFRANVGGPQAAFGRLYQWLQFQKSKRDPGPIRDVLREHILDTMPVAAGADLFGTEVKQRRRHSVASLSKTTGVHARTLNRALVRIGILTHGDEDKTDETASFDAVIGEALAHRIKHSIPITKIPGYLNCNRTQAQMLVKQRILRPLVPGSGRGRGILSNVALDELDEFLSRFRAAGSPVRQAGEGMVDVIEASEIARQTAIDIVRLVLNGRLTKVEVLGDERRFRSILVDPTEVRSVANSLEQEIGLSTSEVAERLGICPSGVTRLRTTSDRDGLPFLVAVEHRNARGTIRYRYSEEDIARFEAKHVALPVLAKERGMTMKAISKSLANAGTEPIIRRSYRGAAIYRRADV